MHTFANNDGVPYLSWFMQRAEEAAGVHFSFLILFPTRPAMLDEIRSHGFDCEWIKYDDRHRPTGMLLAVPKMWWHMMRYRPDIVHGHLFDDTLPGMVAAWLARIKVRLFTRQDSCFHWNYAPRWVFLDRLAARLATRIIAVSEDTRTFTTEMEQVPRTKVGLVHHGIPTERFTTRNEATCDRLRARFGLHDAYPVIGTVARFIEWKGYRHIVDAAKVIVQHYPKVRFLFCGSGPQRPDVEQWVKDAGLEANVVFTGWVDRDDVPSLYRTMDVYLHAADHEPFGFVFAEAMMSGVPVVSTRTGGFADVMKDGPCGVLVNMRTGSALAGGVLSLLDGDHKAVGQAGQAVALARFSFDRMWDGYMAEYQAAVERTI
ncbi:MAG: glycosyltransferase family 4 protein [Flavobacteriales bacterium]|nr:glycosyltransferase family 4 protein [Flavobacteriales bacterium]